MAEEVTPQTGGPGGLTVAGWRIYYGDGTVADSLHSTWQNAPYENVQVMNVYYNETYTIWEGDEKKEYPYREVLTYADYYWPYGCGNSHEAWAAAEVNEPPKRGKLIPDQDWWDIYNRAFADMTL